MRQMKDSGVEWINYIPSDWKVLKLKNVCTRIIVGLATSVTQYYRDTGIPMFRNTNIKEGKLEIDDLLFLDEKWANKQDGKKIHTNDILTVHTGYVGISCIVPKEFEGCLSFTTLISTVNNDVANYRFVYYWINMSRHYSLIYKSVDTGAQVNLNTAEFVNLEIVLPSLTEQLRIADYLDAKCSQIDFIISKQETVIEKLREYKLSVITEAVTRGLDSNTNMKSCDLEWIESVPYHWKSIKLKYCSYIRARLGWKGLKAEEYVDEGFPLLSAFNIVDDKIDFEHNINYINQSRYDESPEIKLSEGDILLVKDGAGIGKCGIVENLPTPSTTNGSLAVITTDKQVYSKYLYFYFLSSVFQRYIDRIKDGMGVPHLFQSDLKEIQIVIPSYEEQIYIVEQLEKKISVIEDYINTAEKTIEKLHLYRKSLIYEVITGKKEV